MTKPLNITILGIRGIPAHYGGFETCVDRTSRLLAAAGHHVTVYNRTQHSETHPPHYDGVHLRYIPRPQTVMLHTIGHTIRCAQHMRHDNIDIVHLYGVGNAPALPFLRRRGRRLIISVDAQDWARAKWGVVARNYLLLSARLATRLADVIVVDSRAIGDYYRQLFNADTHFIAYGAETTPSNGRSWLDKFNLEPHQYHLFVGRLTPEKQPLHLIQAYNQVNCDLPLVIVGEDPHHRGYKEWLQAQGDDRVRLVGAVYDDGFHQLCHHSFLYITASAIEGTSPALLQAMGQGAAVLVNGIPANRETIGPAGFAYAENDVTDLARQWQKLIDNPDLLPPIRRAAVERIRQHYTWPLVTQQLIDLYHAQLS
ncbi:MAG TPA: DUF1972 domain-containing protein [Anaerolineae bacterium]|nr:DUF1972 domain-containing protein [Anaerolineae bacterium]